MSTEQPEALLRLADAYADASFEQGLEKRTLDDAPENARSALETELRRQHAEKEALRAGYDAARLEIASLQAQLEAIGAGGVEPLRKRCLHQVSEPAQAGEYPELPSNLANVLRRIGRCESERAAQVVLENAMRKYADAVCAARGAAQAAPVDAERLDYLQECGVTVDVLPGRPGWTFRIGGLHGTVHRSVRTAIDAARAAQEKK